MILVDTSIWIDHLRGNDETLSRLLAHQQVLCHPFIVGEVTMGSIRQRDIVLSDLRDLPQAIVGEDDEVLQFISDRALFGKGIGYIDAHLLVAVRLTPDAQLWTRDSRLFAAAQNLGLASPHSPMRPS